jgi:hypothetical protein
MRTVAGREIRESFRGLGNEDIEDIVGKGKSARFWQKPKLENYQQLLRRLRRSCYLDDSDRPFTAQERLMEQYRRDGLVLFLGAGVSRGSGIPNWVSLSESMLKEAGAPEPEELDRNHGVKKLLRRFDQAYRRLHCDQGIFLRNLHECLYRKADRNLRNLLEHIPRERQRLLGWQEWVNCHNLLAQNMSLAVVGDLLVIEDKGRWRRNPQIHAVLTVNADNLLELYCLAKTGGHRLVTQVDRASVGDHPNTIPVCHLHGTLDIRGENFMRLPTMKADLLPDVVFRTPEYDRTKAAPSSFVNVTPQSYLQRLNVLFFGTSLDDDNICRWLRESYKERVENRTKYLRELYKDNYGAAQSEAELESVRHFWLRKTAEDGRVFPQEEMKKIEREKRELGVQVVWCEDHGLDCLRRLKRSGSGADFGYRTHSAANCWCNG